MTKNADIDKYKYSWYGIGFDGKISFSFPIGGFGCNVIIFGADMSSSIYVDNRKKDILIIDEGPTQGLDGLSVTTEKKYSVNFNLKVFNKFCLS